MSTPAALLTAPPAVERTLSSPGRPLPPVARAFFEPRLGHDLATVRLHDDAEAVGSARAVGARAYTVGEHVVGRGDRLNADSAAGRRLLGHELVHVLQQRGATLAPATVRRDTSVDEAAPAPASPAPAASTTGAAPAGATPAGAASPARPKPVQVDVIGADASADDVLVGAAAKALGVDIRVRSLPDMIDRLVALAGGAGCVQRLTIWNHGAPGFQEVAGSGPKKPDGAHVPQSGFDLAWLLDAANEANLNRLRGVFCCDATMWWRGCGTAGVTAAGGLRSDQERQSDQLRYQDFGDRYRDVQDAANHGASVLGATFGRVAIQVWADATCTTIVGATDFTYTNPTDPRLNWVGQGGSWVTTPPEAGQCACDPTTGRPAGGPVHSTDLGRRAAELRAAQLPAGSADWDFQLRTLRWALGRPDVAAEINKADRRPDVVSGALNALGALIQIAVQGVVPPAPLTPRPAGEVRPRLALGSSRATAAAVTYPHLAVCEPNYWRWIVFGQEVIMDTPEFTRGLILHELDHAADVATKLAMFQADNGPPPPLPAGDDRCRPIDQGVRQGWTDDWGRYASRFVDFYQGSLPPDRHAQIAVGQRRSDPARWTQLEQEAWVDEVLAVLPPNVAASTPIAAEDPVVALYRGAPPSLRTGIVRAFRQRIENLLRADANATGLAEQCGRVRTQVTHFPLIMQDVFAWFASVGGARFVQEQVIDVTCPAAAGAAGTGAGTARTPAPGGPAAPPRGGTP